MTEQPYMMDIGSCYIKEFEANVLDVNVGDRAEIVLDTTNFYPEGGGQPSDTGWIEWEGGRCRIVEVVKKDEILHIAQGDLPESGQLVKCSIDWDRRYSHMRMHTAQHVISSVVWKRYGAKTVGNQVHADYSHIDFYPLSIDEREAGELEDEINSIIERGAVVNIDLLDREDIEGRMGKDRVDLSRLPRSIKKFRTVLIGENGNVDECPCAGTHVSKLSELGRVRIVKRKSKGKGKQRIQYVLER